MTKRSLQERAKSARLRAGFSLPQQAADAIGCSRPLVLAWESGAAKSIGSGYLLAAAKAYRVRPDWLTLDSDVDGYPWSPDQAIAGDPSQLLQPDPEILAAAIKLVRLTFEALESDHDQEADGVPTALAYAYLAKRQQRMVTGENVVDFIKALRARKGKGAGDGQRVGGTGTGHRAKGAKDQAEVG